MLRAEGVVRGCPHGSACLCDRGCDPRTRERGPHRSRPPDVLGARANRASRRSGHRGCRETPRRGGRPRGRRRSHPTGRGGAARLASATPGRDGERHGDPARRGSHGGGTSFCDAPSRHLDHVVPAAEGGPTTLENGQCLCAFCNLTKESPGWRQSVVASGPGPAPGGPPRESQTPRNLDAPSAWVDGALSPLMRSMAWVASCPQTRRRIADGQAYRPSPRLAPGERPRGRTARDASKTRHTVETRTPTGHTYRSTQPDLPGSPDP